MRLKFCVMLTLACCTFAGCLLCFGLLAHSKTLWPWLATIMSVLTMCIFVCFLKIKELWSKENALIIMAFFGVLQLAILEHIVPPDYWKENADLVRFYGAFFSQPLFCSICCGIAVILETSVNDKTARLVDELQTILEEQVGILSEIKGELIEMSAQYERTWHILKLLDNISDSYLLEKSYINERRKREKDILNKIDGTLSKKKIDIPIEDRVSSDINREIELILAEKKDTLSQLTGGKYTRKDYKTLQNMLTMIEK